MLEFSGTEHMVVLEDKLSTTTVVFFRSEMELKHFQQLGFILLTLLRLPKPI